jgi:hypothetical protein
MQSVLLTTTGKEILSVLRRQLDLEKLKLALDQLPKEQFASIELVRHAVPQPYGAANMSVEVLWRQTA